MKRLLKAVAKRSWKLTAPARRPVARKVDGRLEYLIETIVARQSQDAAPRFQALNERIEHVERHVHAARVIAENQANDTNLLLDSLVREIARLQLQIEILQDRLDEAGPREGLSIVSKAG